MAIPRVNPQTPGLYVVCTVANTDYPTAVPTGAKGVRLWFETSAASGTLITGRVGIDSGTSASDDAIASIANTDAKLGYHPPQMVEYTFPRSTKAGSATYLHLANATALAVVRGQFLF